jgi:hypothetical protein
VEDAGELGVGPENAEQIAKAIGMPPALPIRLPLEESLSGFRAAGLNYSVDVKPAA